MLDTAIAEADAQHHLAPDGLAQECAKVRQRDQIEHIAIESIKFLQDLALRAQRELALNLRQGRVVPQVEQLLHHRETMRPRRHVKDIGRLDVGMERVSQELERVFRAVPNFTTGVRQEIADRGEALFAVLLGLDALHGRRQREARRQHHDNFVDVEFVACIRHAEDLHVIWSADGAHHFRRGQTSGPRAKALRAAKRWQVHHHARIVMPRITFVKGFVPITVDGHRRPRLYRSARLACVLRHANGTL